jgi:DNA-binding transcriptional LysR family regulator
VRFCTVLDWEDLRHFVVFAREGTLSGAARALGVDHATVARRIAALEAAAALKLVDRRTRATTLTDDGRRIAGIAAAMEEAAFAVGRAVQAAKPGVGGEVSVSAPPSLANALIAPQVARLLRQHPGIRIKLIGEKRSASLNRREADVALRLTRPAEPGLIARKIGSFGFSLYGAEAYIRETPAHALAFIAYDGAMDDTPQQKWLKAVAGSRDIVLRTNDLENQAAAARTGVGLAALPHFLGDPDPRLVRYTPSRTRVTHKPVSRDVWLLVHRDLRDAPAVRAVMEFLIGCLKPR